MTAPVTEPELAMYAGLYQDAKARYQMARDELRTKVRAALDGGMTESEAARIAGVTRMTVRAWRGDAA